MASPATVTYETPLSLRNAPGYAVLVYVKAPLVYVVSTIRVKVTSGGKRVCVCMWNNPFGTCFELVFIKMKASKPTDHEKGQACERTVGRILKHTKRKELK